MKKRPISLTTIGWLLIITGSYIFFIGISRMLKFPQLVDQSPIRLFLSTMGLLMPVCAFVAGIAILKRKNWGRFLYVVNWVLSLLFYLIIAKTISIGLLVGTLLFLITLFFLFRPEANDYFTGNKVQPSKG